MNKEELIKDLNNQKDNLDKLFNDFKSNYETKIKEINETIEKLNKQEENNDYDLKYGEYFYYIDELGNIDKNIYEHGSSTQPYILKFGNWSRSEKEMKLRRKYIEIYNKLQNFMRENDIKIDWNEGEIKYFISYDYDKKYISVDYSYWLVHSTFNFFTDTKEQCEKAIELYGEEIREYFEELRRVDYGEYNNYDKE